MNSKKIKARKTFSVLLWGFFISLIIYFALPSVSVEMIWITAMPASYILAHYFVFAKKKIIAGDYFFRIFSDDPAGAGVSYFLDRSFYHRHDAHSGTLLSVLEIIAQLVYPAPVAGEFH